MSNTLVSRPNGQAYVAAAPADLRMMEEERCETSGMLASSPLDNGFALASGFQRRRESLDRPAEEHAPSQGGLRGGGDASFDGACDGVREGRSGGGDCAAGRGGAAGDLRVETRGLAHDISGNEASPALSAASADSMGSAAMEEDEAFEQEYGDELVFLVKNSMQVDEAKEAQTHMPYIF